MVQNRFVLTCEVAGLNGQYPFATHREYLASIVKRIKRRNFALGGKGPRWISANVGSEEAPCWVAGTVETRDGSVVFRRTRSATNKIRQQLPQYELTRIQTHMYLAGLPVCEVWQGKGDVAQLTHVVEFDEDAWAGIKAQINMFSVHLAAMLNEGAEGAGALNVLQDQV